MYNPLQPLGSINGEMFAAASEPGKILLALFIMLLSAKLLAELFERINQPPVVGEILAGILIGPSLLNWVQPTDVTATLAEIGVIFLLFTVGLETRPSDIFKVGGLATIVAILGVIVPFIAGYAILSIVPGHAFVEAIFLGAAMVATSVGITARVLSGLGLITTAASRVILAAAVIDDVIGLLVLAVVSGLATGPLDYVSIALLAVLAIGFTVLTVLFGSRAVKRVRGRVEHLRIPHSLLVFALVLCFGFAALANLIGIAGIVGAFLAGVALSEASEGSELHEQSEALTEFTTPFFLVNIGMLLDLGVFLSPQIIVLSIIVTALAMITKFIGCGLAAISMGRRRAIQIGVGMIPRGEVGIVVAQIGVGLAAVSAGIYGVVLTMAVATTIFAPILIKWAFAGERPRPQPVEIASELDQEIK